MNNMQTPHLQWGYLALRSCVQKTGSISHVFLLLFPNVCVYVHVRAKIFLARKFKKKENLSPLLVKAILFRVMESSWNHMHVSSMVKRYTQALEVPQCAVEEVENVCASGWRITGPLLTHYVTSYCVWPCMWLEGNWAVTSVEKLSNKGCLSF